MDNDSQSIADEFPSETRLLRLLALGSDQHLQHLLTLRSNQESKQTMTDTPYARQPIEMLIPIDAIEVREDRIRKEIDVRKMEDIAKSIARIGLQQPIVVSRHPTKEDAYVLECGAYRLAAHRWLTRSQGEVWEPGLEIEACDAAFFSKIRASVTELEGDMLALVETDENLMRANLTNIERGNFLAKRKEIYERLYPETVKGTAQGEGKKRSTAKSKSVSESQVGSEIKTEDLPKQPSFVEDTSAKTGMSETSIHRDIERVKKITDEAQAKITGTWIAKAGMELDKIKQLSPEDQLKHIDHLLAESWSDEQQYAPRKSGGGTKRQSNGGGKSSVPKSPEPLQHHGDGNPQRDAIAKKLDKPFNALWLISADARAKAMEIENVLAQYGVVPVSDRKRDAPKHLRDLQEKAPKAKTPTPADAWEMLREAIVAATDTERLAFGETIKPNDALAGALYQACARALAKRMKKIGLHSSDLIEKVRSGERMINDVEDEMKKADEALNRSDLDAATPAPKESVLH